MIYFIIKTMISALMIAGISEIGKRSSLMAGVLASLPLTSVLAMIWLFSETKDLQKVTELSQSILWAVIPSLLFFLIFPILTKYGMRFIPALALSSVVMFFGYSLYVFGLKKLGIQL